MLCDAVFAIFVQMYICVSEVSDVELYAVGNRWSSVGPQFSGTKAGMDFRHGLVEPCRAKQTSAVLSGPSTSDSQ